MRSDLSLKIWEIGFPELRGHSQLERDRRDSRFRTAESYWVSFWTEEIAPRKALQLASRCSGSGSRQR